MDMNKIVGQALSHWLMSFPTYPKKKLKILLDNS
jgi:hypothetical protein